jgi:subtilisin family serine protease
MAANVVRRFEVRVASADALDGVEQTVAAVVAAPEIRDKIHPVKRPPLLEVRLEGAASAVSSAVSRVMDRLATVRGARIQHDVTRVQREGRNGPVYPDPLARVRIGAEALPPAGDSVPVTVAIVDSGLMVEHPVFKDPPVFKVPPGFKDHLWEGDGGIHGKQFIEGKRDNDISDQDGHGTLVAGTVLAAAVDAPVKLMAAKFFDAANSARPDYAASALDFAAKKRAKIIVLAWDVGIGSAKLEKAFREACKHALVVIAAGNYGSDNDWHDGRSWARAPVRYTKDNSASTITVMASDASNEKAWFSNYGRESVDLAAPGIGITSTRRCLSKARAEGPTAYGTHGGTSAAAAHVAGAAALLMSRYSKLSVQQIKECLVRSVDTPPTLKCASGGRLNVGAAVACAAKKAKEL